MFVIEIGMGFRAVLERHEGGGAGGGSRALSLRHIVFGAALERKGRGREVVLSERDHFVFGAELKGEEGGCRELCYL